MSEHVVERPIVWRGDDRTPDAGQGDVPTCPINRFRTGLRAAHQKQVGWCLSCQWQRGFLTKDGRGHVLPAPGQIGWRVAVVGCAHPAGAPKKPTCREVCKAVLASVYEPGSTEDSLHRLINMAREALEAEK